MLCYSKSNYESEDLGLKIEVVNHDRLLDIEIQEARFVY